VLSSIERALYQQHYYVLIQFNVLPNTQQKIELQQLGIDLADYFPGNAYWARIHKSFDFQQAARLGIISIDTIPVMYKRDAALLSETHFVDKQDEQYLAIRYYANISTPELLTQIKQLGAIVQSYKLTAPGLVFIQWNEKIVEAIAHLPYVLSVSAQSVKDKALNYFTIGLQGVSALQSPNGKNLLGRGVTVGVGDDADISTHLDFSGRLINRSPWIPNDHGTHTSGTTAGAGIINVKNIGMAPKATIVNQYFSDILTNTPAYILDFGLVATNNSYYSVQVGCPGNGKYDVLSNYIDKQLNTSKDVLHVIAAGNDGTLTCSPLPNAYGTVKSGWQSAKNVLTIGAMNAQDYTIAYFSSRGPLKDGRIKPEIVTNGWAVNSSNANNTYGLNFGTSMAAPSATGAAALMVERYRQLNSGANPSAALIKALMCNTAQDLGNVGPDFIFGFGMLQARKAVDALENNRYEINTVSNSGTINKNLTVPAGVRKLKIMLYWADTAAAVNAGSALVNDLDLTLTAPSNAVHLPLILNPAPANVNAVAVEGADHVNNIEQVTLLNPAAGTYTIAVNGFSVPYGPQTYVLTYEFESPSITVDYPFGGEKWVPGETEYIRWTALDADTNPFIVEYSPNNGATWIPIDSNVSATARSYNWQTPLTATSSAVIRVSRKNTGYIDQSDFTFTILGRPVVTVSKPCPGSAKLIWPKITDATAYEVLQLKGDSMSVIATITDTSYLVAGLNTYATNWFGVAAKNNTVQGRRSVSVSVVANSGTCTGTAFNNDIVVDTILAPLTARNFFSNAAQATQPVKINIVNRGGVTVSGTYQATFRYNGNTINETVNLNLNAGASTNFTFATPLIYNPSGFSYDFAAWVTVPADLNHANDTAYKKVKLINNDPVASLPLAEDFELMPSLEVKGKEMAFGDNKYLDFSANRTRGRVRTFVNTGFALTGNKALTLDQAPYNNISNTDSVTFNYNLSGFTTSQLRYDFYYRNHGQIDMPGNKVWVRGSENNNWVQAFDLFSNQAVLGEWKKGLFNINEVLSNAAPVQTVTATFQIRIGQEGNTSANTVAPEIDIDDGYTFDNLVLTEAFNDIAVTQINSPDRTGCSMTSTTPINIRVKNYNNVPLNNIQVSYQINGGAIITETIATLLANQVLDYSFIQTADMSAFLDYDIDVWAKYNTDTYAANDSVLNYEIRNTPVVTNFPYLQNFENGDGFFYSKGKNNSWQYGTPQGTIITKAASGTKAWVTNLTGNYNDNETSYLYTPCFDVSSLTQPMLSFSHFVDIELDYDYAWVEYSINGATWFRLGATGSGTNWYDNTADPNWRLSKKRWHVASIDIPKPVTGNIRLRFVLSSDAGVTQEGLGIDDIHIFDKATIYTGAAQTTLTQTMSGSNWFTVSSGGDHVVSINPNGNNLGTVTTGVYPYTGQVRSILNQNYLNRNVVIRSVNPALAAVQLRIYFTDTEVEALIAATSCSVCNKPKDAYELATTQYSGSLFDENNLLEDDLTGIFKFFADSVTNIVPFSNGYYAEITVNQFSEFWLGKELLRPGTASRCFGDAFTFNAAQSGTNYQWQMNDGNGFVDIINNANFSGVNTAVVQIANIPTSYSGYTFRCVVDGNPGIENTVRFSSVWTGTSSNSWFNGNNWSCGSVPDEYTDVLIPGGLVTYPEVNGNAVIRSLKAYPGSAITVPVGSALELSGK
jgi:hypothetical protein